VRSEIAHAFLDKPVTMAQRLVRGKAKIAKAGVAYEIPDPAVLPHRLASVLSVIYLIFNEGWHASSGDAPIRCELADDAMRLAALLHDLFPEEPETGGLLALIMFHMSRSAGRFDAHDGAIALEDQDRSLWDRALIAQADRILQSCLSRGRIGPYQLQAAISGVHCNAQSWSATDWPQIVALYRLLGDVTPTPVVRLNHAVAMAQAGEAQEALSLIEKLSDALDDYQPYHAARAETLALCGYRHQALDALDRTALSINVADQAFLERRKAKL